MARLDRAVAALHLGGEGAVALGELLVDPRGLVRELLDPRASGVGGLLVELVDDLQPGPQLALQPFDRRAPGLQRAALAIAQRAADRRAFVAHRGQPRAQRGQALGLVALERAAGFGELLLERRGAAADRGE